MKKLLACILALLLALAAPLALAEAEVPNYEELVVGSTTALSGNFFTDMWGNNTSDADVRMLLHGYNLMQWNTELGNYGVDDSVVSGLVVTDRHDGNRTYTIALYEDMVYSDGTPITAYDYAFSILLSVAPEVAAIGGAVNGSDYIVGIEDYKAGLTEILSGVRVLGDYQLSITVKGEYLPFFYELALLDYNPYPIHVIAPGCEVVDEGEGVYIRNIPVENEEAEDVPTEEAEEEPTFTAELLQETILNPETGYQSHPSVVSGPYVLTSYDAQTRTANFEINKEYKGNSIGQLPQIPRLVFKTVVNETMIADLLSGKVDLLNKCVNAEVLTEGMRLVAENEISVSNYARSGYSFISYACEQDAVASEKVRQAIAHCFDKDTFVADYVRNFGLRVDGYYGIGQWMYQLVEGSLAAPVEAPAETATAEELAAYEAELAQWDELSLEDMKIYNLDLKAAEQLLVDDGWTLNLEGEAFDAEKDAVRCKKIEEELVALDLSMIYPEGNTVGTYMEAFVANLAEIGIVLKAEAVPFNDLLKAYYRQTERDCDMIYLATNFNYVFEPSSTFSIEDAYQGENNRTGIVDKKLYELAVDMRKTEPGDVLSYCQKWVAFQEYYSEVLPTVPVYSNVYFDFYTPNLQEYYVGANASWAQAIVGAYLGDVMEVEEEVVEEEAEFID